MFRKRKTPWLIIGLSFAKDAVHAVAVRMLPSSEVVVEQAAMVPLPPAALGDRDISEPSLVTDAVRKVLSRMPGPPYSVMIGLPSPATIAHAVTLPSVAPKERRSIVRGEIDLLNVLPPGQEAFDFVVFARPEAAASKDNKVDAAFFFAAEQHIVEQFRACVVDAGAQVVGMEPGEYAAVRTVRNEANTAPASLAISLGAHHTYLQFFLNGQPAYARRLDLGAEQIDKPVPATLTPGSENSQPSPMALAEEELAAQADPLQSLATPWQMMELSTPGTPPPSPFFAGLGAAPGFGTMTPEEAARERMLTEIARSIDYFGREFDQEIADMPVVLLSNHSHLTHLLQQADNQLESPVSVASYLDTIPLSPEVREAAHDAQSVQAVQAAFAPALGLALGHVETGTLIPTFDLSREAAEAARARQAPRQLIGAMTGGAFLLALGIGGAFLIEQQAAPVRTELENMQTTLQGLNAQEQRMRTDNLQQMELVRQIRLQNLPWTNVLRNLSLAVPSGVGVTRIAIQGGALSISAETTDSNRIVQFWSRVNTSPFFAGATVTSVQRGDDRYTFQMNVLLPSATPVPTAPAGAKSS